MPYKTQSPDTSEKIEQKQFDLMRRAGAGGRCARCFELTSMVVHVSRHALHEWERFLNKRDALLVWVENLHGPQVAASLKVRWEKVDAAIGTTARPDLRDTMAPFVTLLQKHDVPYFVTGAVASAAHGEPRSTLNVDVVVKWPQTENAFFAAELREHYCDCEGVGDFGQTRVNVVLLHLPTLLTVNVMQLRERAFDQNVMARRLTLTCGMQNQAAQWDFCSPEDLVLANVEWYTLGGGISDQLWRDIKGVLKMQCFTLDLNYLHHWAAEIGVKALLEQALDEAGIR